MHRHLRLLLTGSITTAMTAGLLVACGGGGGGANLGGGTTVPAAMSGTINAFGSVFVNGFEWDTSGADIVVDGAPGTEADLRVGHVVTVRGTLSSNGTGEADTLEFDYAVEGPIESVSVEAGSFVVLDQTIFTTVDTTFDDSIPDTNDGNRGLDDLEDGDVVAVSGYRTGSGSFQATRIELRGGSDDFEITGVVSNLGPTTFTFQIGTQVVSYNGAQHDFPSGDTLSNGDLVEVEGDLSGGVLVAARVERENSLAGLEEGDTADVEGYIVGIVKPGAPVATFTVNGIAVSVNAGTEYFSGNYNTLANGLKVEVIGEVDAAGVLVGEGVAVRVQPEDAVVEIIGNVDTVNVSTRTVSLQGMDIVVRVRNAARLEDGSSAQLEDFSLADLAEGDHISIRGAPDTTTAAGNDVTATRLERSVPDDTVVLRGAVQAENNPDLTILGVTVTTDVADFFDENDALITDSQFFLAIGTGDIVKARSTNTAVSDNELAADEVEIESQD